MAEGNGAHGIADGSLVVVGKQTGITFVPTGTPLTRLNYFDGKFLRAADLTVEQQYVHQLVALSNRGLGAGVVYGYDTVLGAGDTVQIGPGLAIDPAGNVLYLPQTATVSITELIEATRRRLEAAVPNAAGKTGADAFSDCIEVTAPSPSTVVLPTSDLYVIAICHAEALCGEEDVYGKLCEAACVTSTDRPYRLEGIIVRAIPLQLVTQFPISKVVAIDNSMYLRSKVAHSYFADERLKHPHAISRSGLLSTTWCLGAGYDAACCEVPLALVARPGSTTVFLDAWVVRRERMDTPARHYWQWKMMMRPWSVFLAQVLQFQCHLAEALPGTPVQRPDDPCDQARMVLGDATKLINLVHDRITDVALPAGTPSPFATLISLTEVVSLKSRATDVLQRLAILAEANDRVLIRHGIIELPPAGFLPVVTGNDTSVNDQVRALLGEGVDLRFCIVRPDYVGHAFEAAQHLERISLLEGIDNPENMPHVDILVPDGATIDSLYGGDAEMYRAAGQVVLLEKELTRIHGAAREETKESGGTILSSAGETLGSGPNENDGPIGGFWLTVNSVRALRTLRQGETTAIEGRFVTASRSQGELRARDLKWKALFTVDQVNQPGPVLMGKLSGSATLTDYEELPNGIQQHAFPPDPINSVVTLTYDDASDTIAFEVSNPFSTTGIGAQLRLTRVSNQKAGSVKYFIPEPPPSGAASNLLDLASDANVLRPEDPNHVAASRGLQLLQEVLRPSEPNFQDEAEKQLFPPVPPGTTVLTIRPTLDWVMFHRRRDHQCSGVVIPPPVQRRYMVYQFLVSENQPLDRIKQALTTGQNLELTFKAIGPVEFADRQFALADPSRAVALWNQTADKADILRFGVLATVPVEDGAIEAQRLNAVAKNLPLAEDALAAGDLRTIDQPPDWLPLAGTDGIIALVTDVKPQTTTCQGVYRLDPKFRDRILEAIASDSSQAFQMLLSTAPGSPQFAKRLGSATFQGDDPAPLATDKTKLQEKWVDAGGGKVEAVFVFGPVTDLDAKRARVIGEAFATSPEPERHVMESVPDDCPIVTLALPKTTCHEVFALRLNQNQFDDLIGSGDLTRLDSEFKELVTPLGHVVFMSGTDTVVDHNLTKMTNAQLKIAQLLLTTFVEAPAEDPSGPEVRAQLKFIGTTIGLKPPIVAHADLKRVQKMPSESRCPFVDLVLLRVAT